MIIAFWLPLFVLKSVLFKVIKKKYTKNHREKSLKKRHTLKDVNLIYFHPHFAG